MSAPEPGEGLQAAGERDQSRPAGMLSRLLAVCVLAPSALHLVGRGGAGWPVVAAGLALPWIVGSATGGSLARRAGRVLALAVGAALVVPVLPTLVGLYGFSLERVVFGGALSWMLGHGLLAPSRTESGAVLLLRFLAIGWAAWSVGSTLHALWLSFPSDAPFLRESFAAALLDPLGARSMVDPAHPLQRLSERLETLLLLWTSLEVALRDRELPRRLALALAVALPCGIAVNAWALFAGFAATFEPLSVRLSSSLDRVFRPLPDHNSLGSALVLALPPVAWLCWTSWRREERDARRRSLALAGLVAGLALLVGTSSKSAMLGFAVSLGAGVALWTSRLRGRARRVLLAVLSAGLAVPVLVQLLPRETVGELLETRYVRDVVRAARFDFVTDYLRDNRFALWRSGGEMVADAPLAGVGLGRFPSVLPEHHDPDAEGFFNPLQENAHNQYLQWAAEEGLVGAGLGVAILLLALVAGWRAVRSREEGVSESERLGLCAGTAALAGFALNLVVGHPLLVPAVAGLFAAAVGALVAGSSRAVAPRETSRAWPRFAAAWLLFVPLGTAPALFEERAPLESCQLDCFPWLWQPGVEGAPPISRLLGPDARWMQRWGEGSRMILFAKSIVAPSYGDEDQHLDVWVDGERVVEHFALPRKEPNQPVNPVVVLKVDAPAGVRPGDLVEIRVTCDRPYAESIAGGHSQSIWGPRVWPPTFRDPR